MTLIVRGFKKESDIEQIVQLLKNTDLYDERLDYANLNPKYTLVMDNDGMVVGMMSAIVQDRLMAFVPYFVVNEEHKGSIIVGRMVLSLFARLQNDGIRVVSAVWGVNDINVAFMASRFGFNIDTLMIYGERELNNGQEKNQVENKTETVHRRR